MGIYAFMHFLFNRFGALPFEMPHFIQWEIITMTEETKKAKAPSKKELMREIETLDKSKVFDYVSLGRTNIANIKAIAEMLKA